MVTVAGEAISFGEGFKNTLYKEVQLPAGLLKSMFVQKGLELVLVPEIANGVLAELGYEILKPE
jgi:hypothetical protein